jgi:hypothetical protein
MRVRSWCAWEHRENMTPSWRALLCNIFLLVLWHLTIFLSFLSTYCRVFFVTKVTSCTTNHLPVFFPCSCGLKTSFFTLREENNYSFEDSSMSTCVRVLRIQNELTKLELNAVGYKMPKNILPVVGCFLWGGKYVYNACFSHCICTR